MKTKLTDYPSIVLEMTDEPDCQFVGSWLIKAAEAQALWSQALRDPDFESRVLALCVWCIPHLECAALQILAALQQQRHIVAVDLYRAEDQSPIFSTEFAMMVYLGFFAPFEVSYRMTIPESITLENVQLAALSVSSTEEETEEGLLQPDRLLHTLTDTEAKAWRSRLIEMRQFSAHVPRDRVIQ
jgi:hypothetical protein